ncbi:MAG: NYN domain-containing protein [Smithellaceae bacterium]|nr:NYN domain-containing protein [Smithellaceae bacterium]
MHIVIDGYNMIRQSDTLRRLERQGLEAGRRGLVCVLSPYRKIRGHRITVVFDGWASGSPEEERDRMGGVEIIYSRLGEKADEVIKRIADKSGEELLIVTSDRAVADFARRCGAKVLSSPVFEQRIKEAMETVPCPDYGDKGDEKELDRAGVRKGPARRPSRRQKNDLAALRKL